MESGRGEGPPLCGGVKGVYVPLDPGCWSISLSLSLSLSERVPVRVLGRRKPFSPRGSAPLAASQHDKRVRQARKRGLIRVKKGGKVGIILLMRPYGGCICITCTAGSPCGARSWPNSLCIVGRESGAPECQGMREVSLDAKCRSFCRMGRGKFDFREKLTTLNGIRRNAREKEGSLLPHHNDGWGLFSMHEVVERGKGGKLTRGSRFYGGGEGQDDGR